MKTEISTMTLIVASLGRLTGHCVPIVSSAGILLVALASANAADKHGIAAEAMPILASISIEEQMAADTLMNELRSRAEHQPLTKASRGVVSKQLNLRSESASYRVDWEVAAAGGGVSASDSYALVATLGQTATSGFSSSPGFMLDGGFLAPPDSDSDTLRDFIDNCTQASNSGQLDTDGDGIGNACDADIAPVTNDCFVNFLDLNAMSGAFFSNPASPNWNPDADLNGDNFINFLDLSGMSDAFFTAPGPSGIDNGC